MEAVEEQAQATEEKQGTVKITICHSLSGIAEGAEEIYQEFEKQITAMSANAELGDKQCNMGKVGCRGYCSRDVLVDVYIPGQDRVTYEKVKPADSDALVVGFAGCPLDYIKETFKAGNISSSMDILSHHSYSQIYKPYSLNAKLQKETLSLLEDFNCSAKVWHTEQGTTI